MRLINLILLLSVTFLMSCKDEGKTVDSSNPDADADTDSDSDSDSDSDADADAECWVDSDNGPCWDCDLPTTPEAGSLKFLNRCTTVTAAPFDNATRIPATTWTPGNPLPSVQ